MRNDVDRAAAPGARDRGGVQFGTRTMFVTVAICAGVVALAKTSPLWAAIVGWFVVLAAAHVAANVRGSRLRVRGLSNESPDSGPAALERTAAPTVRFAPLTRLRGNSQPGRWLLAAAAVGAVSGSCLVTTALEMGGQTGVPGIVLGGISAAVVGGFLGFLTGSCLGASFRALHEATRDHAAVPRRSTP